MAVITVGPDQTPRVARAGEHLFVASARSFDPADIPYHRRADRAAGERGRPFPRTLRMRPPAGDSNSADGRPPREVTGRMVLVGLVAFFAAVAGVNAVMIWAAVSTFGGVETESSYQAGLAFARETAAVAAQDALHWQVKAKRLRRGGRDAGRGCRRRRRRPPGFRLAGDRAACAPERQARRPPRGRSTRGAPGQFRGHSGPFGRSMGSRDRTLARGNSHVSLQEPRLLALSSTMPEPLDLSMFVQARRRYCRISISRSRASAAQAASARSKAD